MMNKTTPEDCDVCGCHSTLLVHGVCQKQVCQRHKEEGKFPTPDYDPTVASLTDEQFVKHLEYIGHKSGDFLLLETAKRIERLLIGEE